MRAARRLALAPMKSERRAGGAASKFMLLGADAAGGRHLRQAPDEPLASWTMKLVIANTARRDAKNAPFWPTPRPLSAIITRFHDCLAQRK